METIVKRESVKIPVEKKANSKYSRRVAREIFQKLDCTANTRADCSEILTHSNL